MRKLQFMALSALMAGAACLPLTSQADNASGKKPLQIFFMLGQSEMVGRGDLSSLSYMLCEPLVPPREATVNAHKAMPHQINGAYLYWQAMLAYDGPEAKKAELKKLLQKRSDFKATFKQHVVEELEKNNGIFNGKKYPKRRGHYRGFWLFNLCDEECEKVGLTPKIRAILDAPDNAFNVETAYNQIMDDANKRYRKQIELNKRYLKGTKTEDFADYAKALKAYQDAISVKNMGVKEKRLAIAELAEKYLHLPMAKRTYITGLGTLAGSPGGDLGNTAGGKLSVGYGANEHSIGLEYGVGMALEQRIDAPILIIKCAWESRRSLADFWRIPATASATPATAQADKPGRAWEQTRAYIRKVLADPGTYHPDFDPEAGFEAAGLIWFQGSTDQNNPEYAEQFASLLNDFRKTVKKPDLPVICLTVGSMFFKAQSDDNPVNEALHEVAALPEFNGTVTVMDSYLWRPSELSLMRSMLKKRKISPDAALPQALGGSGDAPFYLMAGHEAGSRLAARTGGKHLFILSGQSNMVGMDPEISFSPAIKKAFGDGHVIIVQDAHGGQSIRAWAKSNHEYPPPTVGRVPKVRGMLYDQLMKKVTAAIRGQHVQTVTFIWMQGESDLRNTAYGAYLKELMHQLQTDLCREDINLVIGRISDNGLDVPKRLEGRKTIRRIQVEFAESWPHGAWVNTDDLNDKLVNGKLVNDLHYTDEGYKTLGSRFADEAIELVKKTLDGPINLQKDIHADH